ncbi:Uncharacterized protein FKW44_011552 [Caligus rogercresseyi]|uniref:palmitoyl-protein hydrolase n=1 Tax=Caligus rogercresseyi TaxID=217165 RepID=A0A7T8HIA8_CALRO|nr:Uncharacterized protein FKW44_011552 [Caligus rogercresseyi]
MGSSSSKRQSSMSSGSRNEVVISPRVKHTGTLIFLHGLGIREMAGPRALRKSDHPTLRSFAPRPTFSLSLSTPATTCLHGSIYSHLSCCKTRIESIIAKEIADGIPPERIGGALALHAGLTGSYKLGGVIALSCWLPLHKEFSCSGKEDVPVLQLHGTLSSTVLKNSLRQHEFKTYEGLAHQSSSEELEDVKAFLNQVLRS